MSKQQILEKIERLIEMYQKGELGGEVMPEDSNPNLQKSSLENYIYFTLPMALNYQRNSYKLWESASKTYEDKETNFVFCPKKVLQTDFDKVQSALIKYKVALQKQKQTEIWITLCNTFMELFQGDIRKLFDEMNNDVEKIRNFIQISWILMKVSGNWTDWPTEKDRPLKTRLWKKIISACPITALC